MFLQSTRRSALKEMTQSRNWKMMVTMTTRDRKFTMSCLKYKIICVFNTCSVINYAVISGFVVGFFLCMHCESVLCC